MKKNLFYVMSLAAVFSLGSCSQEELADAQNEDAVKLGIQSIAAASINSRVIVEGNSLPNGASVGLFLQNSSSSGEYATGTSNIEYTATGTGNAQKWNSNSAPTLTTTSGKAYLYYPYNSAATDITAIPVNLAYGNQDFLYSSTPYTASKTSNSATFTMKHLCALFVITIQKGTYLGNCNVTQIGPMIDGTSYGGTFNLKTNQFTNDNDVWPSEEEMAVDLSFKNSPIVYEHLIIPDLENVPSEYRPMTPSLELHIDGTTHWVPMLLDVDGEQIEPQAGYKYEVVINVNAKTLKVSTVNVTPWNLSDGWESDIEL